MQIQINSKTSAHEIITEVYRQLPNLNYKQNWQLITEGLEGNLSEVKDCAEKIGVRIIEVEAE